MPYALLQVVVDCRRTLERYATLKQKTITLVFRSKVLLIIGKEHVLIHTVNISIVLHLSIFVARMFINGLVMCMSFAIISNRLQDFLRGLSTSLLVLMHILVASHSVCCLNYIYNRNLYI